VTFIFQDLARTAWSIATASRQVSHATRPPTAKTRANSTTRKRSSRVTVACCRLELITTAIYPHSRLRPHHQRRRTQRCPSESRPCLAVWTVWTTRQTTICRRAARCTRPPWTCTSNPNCRCRARCRWTRRRCPGRTVTSFYRRPSSTRTCPRTAADRALNICR
jgi:hypothetical protein